MIAAVVVTFSAPADVLDRCLRALCGDGGLDQIVVVDTGGSAQIAPDLAEVAALVRMENRGYGAAANLGFGSVSDASAVVLLNDDVVVRPGWLAPLVDELAPEDVGATQPALLRPGGDVVVSLGVALDRYGAGSDIGDGGVRPTDRSPTELDIFTGGAVLFDTRFLQSTGGFDERFFLYYEDVDLALRGRSLGWRFRLVPDSIVEHCRGTSTGELADDTRFYQERNRLWMAFRYASVITIARALLLSVRRLRHGPRAVHRRALVAGLAGAPRRLVERARAVRELGGSLNPTSGMEET